MATTYVNTTKVRHSYEAQYYACKKMSTYVHTMSRAGHVGMKCNVLRHSQRSALLQLIKSCQSHLMHYSAPESFRLSQIACLSTCISAVWVECRMWVGNDVTTLTLDCLNNMKA